MFLYSYGQFLYTYTESCSGVLYTEGPKGLQLRAVASKFAFPTQKINQQLCANQRLNTAVIAWFATHA